MTDLAATRARFQPALAAAFFFALAACESGPIQLRPITLPLACPCECHCDAQCKLCPDAHKQERQPPIPEPHGPD